MFVCVDLLNRNKTCAGGANSSFSLAPTKTLNVAGDFRADHPDVPASFGDWFLHRFILPFFKLLLPLMSNKMKLGIHCIKGHLVCQCPIEVCVLHHSLQPDDI